MTESALFIDSRELDIKVRRFAEKITRLPRDKRSPLYRTAQRYRLLLEKSYQDRPTIATAGTFQGEDWPKLEPAYTRITDGVSVPVWGGVPRAVLGKGFGASGAHSRLGVVTRARDGGIRTGHLEEAQIKGGFRGIRLGQRFSQATVRPKLRSNGTPYKATDRQLGNAKGRSMIGEGLKNRLQFGGNNLSVRVVWPHPAASVHQYGRRFRIKGHLAADGTHGGGVGEIPARPFMWTKRIADKVRAILEEELKAYAIALWRGREGLR